MNKNFVDLAVCIITDRYSYIAKYMRVQRDIFLTSVQGGYRG